MLIVDAQIHLWNAGNPTTAWHRQVPAYTKVDALEEMDAGGVDAALLTPHTPWDPNASELAIEAARQHPDRFAILCRGTGTAGRSSSARPWPSSRRWGTSRAQELPGDLPSAHPGSSRLWPGALVLGHRHHAHALPVAPVRDALHRRAAVAPRT